MTALLLIASLLVTPRPLPESPAETSGDPASAASRQAERALYEVVLLRAAPGRLLELIGLYQARIAELEGAGEGKAHLMRHSQGDQWDLLILIPMDGFERYFSPEQADWNARLDALVAWRQELFAWGPRTELLNERFEGARFYHVEMFVALPGKREGLIEQRQMENQFLRAIGRPDNLIFTRAAGAEWDAFTLGFYRDLLHFAESPDLEPGAEDEAARAAGFEAANRIGTYLRTLMAYHHDTLARSVD